MVNWSLEKECKVTKVKTAMVVGGCMLGYALIVLAGLLNGGRLP